MTQNSKEIIDCLFILALDEEFQVFHELFTPMQMEPWIHKGRCWTHALPGDDGKLLLCKTVVMEDQGPENAAKATANALNHYLPKVLVSIGISGRLNDDVGLGDVVIADSTDNPFYRAKIKKGKVNFGGEATSLKRLTELAWKTLESRKPVLSFGPELNAASKAKLMDAGLTKVQPKITRGPICTTPAVIDDEDFQGFLKDNRNRLYLACDMESHAVVNAASDFNLGDENILVIRGISDPADGRKRLVDQQGKGAIRRAAMMNAAKVARHFLSSFDLQGSVAIRSSKTELQRNSDIGFDDLANLLNKLFPNDDANFVALEACKKIDFELKDKPIVKEELDNLAEAAYHQQISNKTATQFDEILTKVSLKSQDYLIARHVMRGVLVSGRTTDKSLFDPFLHVYPYRINRFCKAILNSAREPKQVVENLVSVYNGRNHVGKTVIAKHRFPETVKAHVCYLLGRIEDRQQKDIAVKLLSAWVYEFSSIPKNESQSRSLRSISKYFWLETPAKRMLLRTTLISLILLGQNQWEEVYVELCVRNKDFDGLNRGFHLEYYGDIPFDATAMMSHRDDLCPFPLTYEVLSSKLKESFIGKKPYPLRNLELQTLMSLAQHRQAGGVLDAKVRTELTLFLDSVLNQDSSTLPILRGYAALVQDSLRDDSSPFDLLKKVHELKKLPRSGWNNSKKGRIVINPESIMSHVGGGLMLIHLCLPEKLPQKDIDLLGAEACSKYSKNQILKMFLVHDLAEAYTDDLLPENRNENTVDNEKLVMSKIDVFSTLPGFEPAATYALWNEFEGNTSINAKIAKEIDALDNLVQLLIENNKPDSVIPDYEDWRSGLRKRVSTPVGKRLLALIDPM
jgi:nucleoside phosphorylase